MKRQQSMDYFQEEWISSSYKVCKEVVSFIKSFIPKDLNLDNFRVKIEYYDNKIIFKFIPFGAISYSKRRNASEFYQNNIIYRPMEFEFNQKYFSIYMNLINLKILYIQR